MVVFCLDSACGDFLEELLEQCDALDLSSLRYSIFGVNLPDFPVAQMASATNDLLDRMGTKQMIPTRLGEVFLVQDQCQEYPLGFLEWLRELLPATRLAQAEVAQAARITKPARRARRKRAWRARVRRAAENKKLKMICRAVMLVKSLKMNSWGVSSHESASEADCSSEGSSMGLSMPRAVGEYLERRKSFPQSRVEQQGGLQRTEFEIFCADLGAAEAQLRRMRWVKLIAKAMLHLEADGVD